MILNTPLGLAYEEAANVQCHQPKSLAIFYSVLVNQVKKIKLNFKETLNIKVLFQQYF